MTVSVPCLGQAKRGCEGHNEDNEDMEVRVHTHMLVITSCAFAPKMCMQNFQDIEIGDKQKEN